MTANTSKCAEIEILKKCEMLRQYSRFVEIVRSYGHIDQLTSAAMVQIMEYIFVFTPCKRLAPTTKLPRILPGGFVVYDGHAVRLW